MAARDRRETHPHQFGPKVDLTGQQFGRLTVKAWITTKGWRCRCRCGRVVYLETRRLLTIGQQSCGCQRLRGLQKLKPRVTPRQVAEIKKLRQAGYSTGRIADRVGVGRGSVNRYAPAKLAYWSGVIPQLKLIANLRASGVPWKEVNRQLGYTTTVQTLLTKLYNVRRRLLLLEQVEIEELSLEHEGIKWLTSQGFGSKVIAEALETTSRRVVRHRNQKPQYVQRREQALGFPYDFELTRELYMDYELSWWEIKSRLQAAENPTKLEQLFHAEADRRAGLIEEQARDRYEARAYDLATHLKQHKLP